MRGLFKRGIPAGGDTPGRDALAVPARAGQRVPAGLTGLVFDERGNLQRFGALARLAVGAGQSACLFHPGPYRLHIAPYAQAPEAILRLTVLVDTPDPRVTVQRFDLFLAAEARGSTSVAELRDLLETAVRREIAQGGLFLPPCTGIDEWHAFRRGLDELVYMRFGLVVDDCLPADPDDSVDFAAMLAARAQAQPAGAPLLPAAPQLPAGAGDARAMRRLFLELPGVTGGLRAALPPAGVPFALQRALLARLDRACASVETMPALALRAPREPIGPQEVARRAGASMAAAAALDEAWALLGRLRAGAPSGHAFDEADRIVANLEHALGERRAADAGEGLP